MVLLKVPFIIPSIFVYMKYFFNEPLLLDELNTYLLVIEWANDGSLHEYLTSNFSSMTGDGKLRLAKEITKGVMCLHKKGIIHRDLVINTIYGKHFIKHFNKYFMV